MITVIIKSKSLIGVLSPQNIIIDYIYKMPLCNGQKSTFFESKSNTTIGRGWLNYKRGWNIPFGKLARFGDTPEPIAHP
jgi:hypothetical protein